MLVAACGRASTAPRTPSSDSAAGRSPAGPPAPGALISHRRGAGLAIGLTEPNPSLIWSTAARPTLPVGFGPWRDRLAALHPDYLRVVVDWAKLQPSRGRPAGLAAALDGCERGVPPCAHYAGLRDLFAAVASHPGLTPVLVVYGVPAWAAQPPSGCERPGTLPRSRALAAGAVAAYRALIRSLLALARGVGLELPWWSPWNEPNHPYFISPQRPGCSARAPARSPAVYARLVLAMRAELAADGRPHRLVLGDLAGFTTPRPDAVGLGEFIAALPADVACSGGVWAVHYGLARLARRAQAAVAALEQALSRRPCTARTPIWVTEAGAPTVPPGLAGSDAAASCRELAAVLAHWNGDRRVDAVFQYTFRQDPLFPDGLADAGLTHLYPAYQVWRAWGSRRPADPPPATSGTCR